MVLQVQEKIKLITYLYKLYKGIDDKSSFYGTLQNRFVNYQLMDLNEISLFHAKNISILSVEIRSPNALSFIINIYM